jgi:hypothetical protein
MKHPHAKRGAIGAAILIGAALGAGCSGLGSSGENFNKPPVFEGSGCYDHKNRIDRTITTRFECERQSWVWKTAP